MALKITHHLQTTTIELSGDMRRFDASIELQNLLQNKPTSILINAKNLQFWDSTTASIIYQIMRSSADVKLQNLPKGLGNLIKLAFKIDRKPFIAEFKEDFFENIGDHIVSRWQNFGKSCRFLQQIFLSIGRLLRGKAFTLSADWFDALSQSGPQAIGIIILASFMTGLILAFVGSLQLQMFGAQIYVASLVTIAMVRIMGAIMTGIIMAGRSGAQMAAVIGSMKVNEELDALKTMGLPAGDMVILPRLIALTLSCPFLTIFADLAGILGGMLVAVAAFDISTAQYWYYVTQAFSLRDFTIGIIHGGIYGFIISSCGCYFGINCGRDAKSVGEAATRAVVSSIVIMIVATGILTWIIEGFGI